MVVCKCGQGFASRARHRITIEKQAATGDAYGGRKDVWSTYLTVWAIVEPASCRETFSNLQLQSRVDSRITIRYRDDLSNTISTGRFRVRLGSRLYNVQAVLNLDEDMKTEGTRYQKLLCTEGEPS